MPKFINDHLWMMDEALIEAFKAYKEDEVPIGAVIVGPDRSILSRAHNQKEKVNKHGHISSHSEHIIVINC